MPRRWPATSTSSVNYNYLDVWNHDRFLDQAAARSVHRRRRARAVGVRDLMTHVPVMTAEVLQLPAARARRTVRRLHGRPRRPRASAARRLARPAAARTRSRSRRAGARARDAGARGRSQVELVHADYRDDRRRARSAPASPRVDGALADLGVSSLAVRRRRAAASVSSATSRSTCGWIAPPAKPRRDLVARTTRARARRRDFSVWRGAVFAAHRAGARSSNADDAPIDTTDAWRRSSGARFRAAVSCAIDPATRTFQALRIWVNRELEGLDRFVATAGRTPARRRAHGGHHLPLARRSDRRSTPCALSIGTAAVAHVLTKKPIVPTPDELTATRGREAPSFESPSEPVPPPSRARAIRRRGRS